jgi:hypothetical protein
MSAAFGSPESAGDAAAYAEAGVRVTHHRRADPTAIPRAAIIQR